MLLESLGPETVIGMVSDVVRGNYTGNDGDPVKPIVYTIDITSGKAYKILGSGHDIARLLDACKTTMHRIEDDKLDPDKRHHVTVPAREAPH
jgi:hypothetical protein